MPSGELLCVKNKSYKKWLISNHSSPIYLPKKEHKLAKLLAAKKYFSCQQKELTWEAKLLDQFLNHYSNYNEVSSSLLSDSSLYKDLLHDYLNDFPTKFSQWLSEAYVTNTSHPETLIYKTLDGHLVRSKSEVMISNALYQHRIPYRYECQLVLDNIILYPDFTTYDTEKMQPVYWEHFGMMDQSTYRDQTYNKLKIYGNNDIIPSVNLITTYESKTHPMDPNEIEYIITHYLHS